MTIDPDGNCYIIGSLNNHTLNKPKDFNGNTLTNDKMYEFVAKIDANGNQVWHQPFVGDTIMNYYVRFASVLTNVYIDRQDNIHCSFFGGSDFVLGPIRLFGQDTIAQGIHEAIFDQGGNYLGYNSFPFDGSNNLSYIPRAADIKLDKKGNYYLTTTFSQDTIITSSDTLTHVGFNNLLLMSFDSTMQERWRFVSSNPFDQTLGGFVMGDTVFVPIHFQSTNVSSVQFGSKTHNTGSQSSQEAALCLLDAQNGQVIGLFPNIGLFNSNSFSWGVHANQHFMGLAGDFREKMSFSGTTNYMDPNTASTAFSNRDNFFVAFDRQGNFIREEFLSTFDGAYENITAMHFKDSVLYVTGSFQDTLRIPGVDTLIALGSGDIFVAKYDLNGSSTGIGKNGFIKADHGLLAYPNPTTGLLNIVGKAFNNQAQLFDVKGQLLRTISISQTALTQQVSLENLKPGLYFIMVVGENAKQVLKVLKQ